MKLDLNLPRLTAAQRTLTSTAAWAALFVFAVYCAFYLMRGVGFLEEVVDSALDQGMVLRADVGRAGAVPPPTLVDFDDQTFAQLSDPIVVPPLALAAVLMRLEPLRPRAIFVDLDVSYLPAEEVEPIAGALRRLDAAGVTVLLAREVLPGNGPDRPGRLRPTSLDPLVDQAPNLTWVGAKLLVGSDGLVRHLAPLEAVRDGTCVKILPSPALTLMLLDRLSSLPAVERTLRKAVGGAACRGPAPNGVRVRIPGGDIRLDRSIAARIDFTMPWDRWRDDALPALPLIRARADLDPDPFRERLVVIGSTAGSRDLAQTPLGRMPGAWIHANAIQDWRSAGPEPDVRFWKGAAVVVPLSVLITFVVVALILRVPSRFRSSVRSWTPLLITSLLWLVFQVLGAPSLSVGLFVMSYVLIAIILFAEKRIERISYGSDR